jgi:hypothetical protein
MPTAISSQSNVGNKFSVTNAPAKKQGLANDVRRDDTVKNWLTEKGDYRMRLKISSAVVAGVLLVVGFCSQGVAFAHHSVQAEFDVSKRFTVSGNIAKVEWINPHSYITIDTKDASGKSERWAFEMAGPGALRKAGLSREDRGGLKLGDLVTITALAAKDGSTTGFLQEIKFPDGRVFKFGTDANGN